MAIERKGGKERCERSVKEVRREIRDIVTINNS